MQHFRHINPVIVLIWAMSGTAIGQSSAGQESTNIQQLRECLREQAAFYGGKACHAPSEVAEVIGEKCLAQIALSSGTNMRIEDLRRSIVVDSAPITRWNVMDAQIAAGCWPNLKD